MSRINLDMTALDAIIAICEGNPGAVTVCAQLMSDTSKIDPDSMLGGLGAILTLDEYEIYGPRIWMFYKDFCGMDITNMLAVLRADQLGQLAGVTRDKIHWAIDHCGEGIDLGSVLKEVTRVLPNFNS